jgi:selenide,water dikinase
MDEFEELLVGFETADDAAVVKISDSQALLLTVDFFPPVVDSPYLFGQIAAANALSDIYAMGGKPLAALNLVAFPCGLGMEVLGEILQGGRDKVQEAGAFIVGGHTIQDSEPKYGLAVTGIASIENLVTNSGAKVGDHLVLTKPLGIGILTTALKGGLVSEKDIQEALDSAAFLNKTAAEVMKKVSINACTDITGFGLAGHLREMLISSGVAARIQAKNIPIWDGVVNFINEGIVPGGARANYNFLREYVTFSDKNTVPTEVLFDPQTSGGLLLSVPEQKLDQLLGELKARNLNHASVIGQIVTGQPGFIEVL